MSLRLFVAVGVPAGVRTDLHGALEGLRQGHPWLRWTDPSNWHLTLAFLGWVDEQRAGEAEDAVRATADGHAPFGLCLDRRLGTFGRRVLWVGIAEGASALQALAGHVRAELAARGVDTDERPFHPHLTVARAPRDRRLPRDIGQAVRLPAWQWEVDEALLMRSHLGRGGARYETWARAQLSATGP